MLMLNGNGILTPSFPWLRGGGSGGGGGGKRKKGQELINVCKFRFDLPSNDSYLKEKVFVSV